jgi:hypothetical protein
MISRFTENAVVDMNGIVAAYDFGPAFRKRQAGQGFSKSPDI